MTLANKITISRLLMIPVFLILIMIYSPDTAPWARMAALVVYAVAGLSDALDGFVARAYDQKTKLGAVLDPLADKLLINLAFVFLAASPYFRTYVPAWLPVIILSRDVLITLGAYLIHTFFGPLRVRPRFLSKINTGFQMSSIVAVLLELRIAWPLLMTMLVITVVSGLDYLYSSIRRIGNEDRE